MRQLPPLVKFLIICILCIGAAVLLALLLQALGLA
jgi:hypothetical protein